MSPRLGGASGDEERDPGAAVGRGGPGLGACQASGERGRDAAAARDSGKPRQFPRPNALIVRSAARRTPSLIRPRSSPCNAMVSRWTPANNSPHYAAASPSMSSAIPMSFILR